MMPDSGGQYVYLREAYGRLPAFVAGWVAFLITQSGSIAAVSMGFGIYLSYLLPHVPGVTYWAPVGVIALFTFGFELLARGKVLRGTPLDPFGRTAVRRLERSLAAQHAGTLRAV